jgi:hypothetical protein
VVRSLIRDYCLATPVFNVNRLVFSISHSLLVFEALLRSSFLTRDIRLFLITVSIVVDSIVDTGS